MPPFTQQQFGMPPLQTMAPQQQGIVYPTEALPPMQYQQQQGAFPQQGQAALPGMQQTQPYYPQQPQQLPQQQPPQWQQPQQQPPQWQQPQQSQRMQLDENVVLDGPGVLPELRGRTLGDAMRLHRALSTDWLARQRQVATPAQQTLQAQGLGLPPVGPGGVPQAPQQQSQPQQQFQQQQQQPQWTQPIQQAVNQAIQQQVVPLLQPVVQESQTNGILRARQQAAALNPDFQYLEADVMQRMAGVAPDFLASTDAWQLAIDAARGARQRQGQYQFRPQPRLPGQNGGPGVSVPANQQPTYQFFTESPSAPQVGAGLYGSSGRQATQEDAFYARAFGMDLNQYMGWKYGVQQAPMALGSY